MVSITTATYVGDRRGHGIGRGGAQRRSLAIAADSGPPPPPPPPLRHVEIAGEIAAASEGSPAGSGSHLQRRSSAWVDLDSTGCVAGGDGAGRRHRSGTWRSVRRPRAADHPSGLASRPRINWPPHSSSIPGPARRRPFGSTPSDCRQRRHPADPNRSLPRQVGRHAGLACGRVAIFRGQAAMSSPAPWSRAGPIGAPRLRQDHAERTRRPGRCIAATADAADRRPRAVFVVFGRLWPCKTHRCPLSQARTVGQRVWGR